MENDIINENDKNEIKKSIKNNGLGIQRVNITDDRIYIGTCFLNKSADDFLNSIKKECKISPVRKRVFVFNQIWPVQDNICEKIGNLGSYMKNNMLHINDDISCYTTEIKKNSEKVFNNDENNL